MSPVKAAGRSEAIWGTRFNMGRKKMESRTSHKAGKPSHRGANGYIHVAKPATASEILRAWGFPRLRQNGSCEV